MRYAVRFSADEAETALFLRPFPEPVSTIAERINRIHGHAHPMIVKAACEQMQLGTVYGRLT